MESVVADGLPGVQSCLHDCERGDLIVKIIINPVAINLRYLNGHLWSPSASQTHRNWITFIIFFEERFHSIKYFHPQQNSLLTTQTSRDSTFKNLIENTS